MRLFTCLLVCFCLLIMPMSRPLTAAPPGTEGEECSMGVIISGQGATITRAAVGLKPGALFSDAGGFKEHGADEPCDPGKAIGPFPVDAGGKMRLTLSGGPPVQAVWSLYNSGVGVKVSFEPRIGSGFGPAAGVLSVGLGVGETKAEMEGEWPGPGRIRAYIGAPSGSGPLTGSCFTQSYSLVAEVIEASAETAVKAGMEIRDHDVIKTDGNGFVLISGSKEVIGPNSEVHFENTPPGPALRLPSGEVFPDYQEPGLSGSTPDLGPGVLHKLLVKMAEFEARGHAFPPANDNWQNLATSTLARALERIQDKESCEAALELKLFLEANQDEFTLRALGKTLFDVGAIWIWDTTNYDGVNWLAKKILAPIPGIGYVAAAENAHSTHDRVMKDWTGTVAGQKSRWTLAAYDRSRAEKWDAGRIDAEQRSRQADSQRILGEIDHMREVFDKLVDKKTAGHEKRLADLREDLERRKQKIAEEFRFPYYKQMGRQYDIGSPDRWQVFLTRQGSEDYLTGKLIAGEEQTHNGELQDLANAYEKRVTERLTEITRLQTEHEAMENYARPLAAGKCDSLKKQAQPATTCSSGVRKLLKGLITVEKNDRDPFVGHSISVNLGELFDFLIYHDGTAYEVHKDEAGAGVRVREGRVKVVGPGGTVVMVEAGQQFTLPGGGLSPLAPAEPDHALRVHGLELAAIQLDSDVEHPPGDYPLTLDQGKPAGGWIWQDPGGDAHIEPGGQGAIRITVPDGNDMWRGRGDSPRLLHKASGDFDLELWLGLECGGNHFAITEFLLHAPGSQLGFLAGQMDEMGPSADYLLMGGGWYQMDNLRRLSLWERKYDEGVEPPAGRPVRLRFSRRGPWFTRQWSLDGATWNLAQRSRVAAPDTLWVGLSFKRIAADGQHEAAAVNTIRDLDLRTATAGRLFTPAWLTREGFGRIHPLAEGWRFSHDQDRLGDLRLTEARPLSGDFDAVVLVDMGAAEAAEGQGWLAGFGAIGDEEKDRVYAVLGASASHGRRYAADLRAGGSWGEYHWQATVDQSSWLRIVRKQGRVSAFFWQLGHWVGLAEFKRPLEGELFLDFFSQNDWEARTPAAFAPVLALERLVMDKRVGDDYCPVGYSLLVEEAAPALNLPAGVEARLFRAPFPVMNPFFDQRGSLYLLPADLDQQVLIRLDRRGKSSRFAEGEVFRGLNWKRGLWQDDRLLVSVDSWPEGGNRNGGLYEARIDGSFSEITLQHGHGGMASMNLEAGGVLLLSDFEYDGLWRQHPDGSEVDLWKKPLPCAMDVAVDPATSEIFLRNDAEGYTCGEQAGIFRLDAEGLPQTLFSAPDNKNLGGMVWVAKGLLPQGLYVSVPLQGKLLRVARDGAVTPVFEGLTAPGMMAVTSSGDGLALMLGSDRILVLRNASRSGGESAPDLEIPAGPPTLSGLWQGPGEEKYLFTEESEHGFHWTQLQPPSGQVGTGAVQGDALQVRWRGSGESGATQGRVTRRDVYGRPTQLTWDDGRVFNRVK